MVKWGGVLLCFLCIKLFELGVEVAFYNRSAVTHIEVNQLESSRPSSCSERTDDTVVMLNMICLSFDTVSSF